MVAKKQATGKKAKASSTRRIKPPAYKTFRLSKRIRHPGPKLPAARKLFTGSVRHLLSNKKLYFGISAVYLILTILLVRGFGFGFDSQLVEVKEIITDASGDQISEVLTGAALLAVLVDTVGQAPSQVGGIYQSILLVIVSLALIWALRQTHANERPQVKDAFYRGMQPLVPFILVFTVIILQLIPLAIGNFIFNIVIRNGLAVTGFEQFIWAALYALLALVSFYMLTSSLFALYIVTLPDITPMQALRSARELVRYRRLSVVRKIVFLPLVALLLLIVIMLPVVYFLTPVAEIILFVFTIFGVAIVHAYMYELYRKLL